MVARHLSNNHAHVESTDESASLFVHYKCAKLARTIGDLGASRPGLAAGGLARARVARNETNGTRIGADIKVSPDVKVEAAGGPRVRAKRGERSFGRARILRKRTCRRCCNVQTDFGAPRREFLLEQRAAGL